MLLLDTHALIWWLTGSRRLSSRAAKEIRQAKSVLVSPISCWECAVLVRKRRIQLDRDLFEWIGDALSHDRVDVAPLTVSAAASAGMLGDAFDGDFADRFLYASARELAVPLVTKDDAIRAFARASGDVQTIW